MPAPQKASFQSKPADADRWIHVVPFRGDMFVRNLKIPLLAGQHWRRTRKKQTLSIAQNDLIERIVKLESNFDLLDLAIAAVLNRSENVSDFLIQKVGCPAHLGIEKMNL